MMFFGRRRPRYTGLWNRYQGFVDPSDLLQANRAVLLAARCRTTPPPAATAADLLGATAGRGRSPRPAQGDLPFRLPGFST